MEILRQNQEGAIRDTEVHFLFLLLNQKDAHHFISKGSMVSILSIRFILRSILMLSFDLHLSNFYPNFSPLPRHTPCPAESPIFQYPNITCLVLYKHTSFLLSDTLSCSLTVGCIFSGEFCLNLLRLPSYFKNMSQDD